MRFDVAAVDGKLVGNGAGGRHRLEDAPPDTTLRPAIVPVVDRCRRPIDGRNVAPSTARLQDMQDARDDRAVVDARLARPAARQARAERLQASSDSQNKLCAMTIALFSPGLFWSGFSLNRSGSVVHRLPTNSKGVR